MDPHTTYRLFPLDNYSNSDDSLTSWIGEIADSIWFHLDVLGTPADRLTAAGVLSQISSLRTIK